jgi:hypothetical protein
MLSKILMVEVLKYWVYTSLYNYFIISILTCSSPLNLPYLQTPTKTRTTQYVVARCAVVQGCKVFVPSPIVYCVPVWIQMASVFAPSMCILTLFLRSPWDSPSISFCLSVFISLFYNNTQYVCKRVLDPSTVNVNWWVLTMQGRWIPL